MPFVFNEDVHMQSSNFECEDLFQTMKISAKAMNQLVTQVLDAFRCYHIDVDNCKSRLPLWHTKEHKYLVMGLFT
jgi:hypothetical protein